MRCREIAALLAILLVPAVVDAKPRKKAKAAKADKAGAGPAVACGVKLLPLSEGNTWTYSPVVPPTPPVEAFRRIAPAQPKQIVIKVKSVETKGADTVVTLEEAFQIDRTKPGEEKTKPVIEERTITSTITCSDKKFDISPESFFFAGEPGGYTGLEITKLERVKGTSWQLTKGAVGDEQWREDLKLAWEQKPHEGSQAKLGAGKLELERAFTPQDPEPITTKMGMYRADKLGLVTTGRVVLDSVPEGTKPMELPIGWISQLWVATDVGMVQSLNSYGHMYQLVDMQLAGAPKPADK